MERFDVAIIGGGGAGMTAALYAARGRRRTVVFERLVTGGQISTTDIVENFPGFPDGVNGFDLAQLMEKQAQKFGAEIRPEQVTALTALDNAGYRLDTDSGQYEADTVIVAAGADYNHLGVPGEAELTGKGVSYCATCDGAFFRDQDVVVVGGGDSAMEESLFLARIVRSVTVIHRRDALRASAILQERAFSEPKISFTWNTVVEAIEGKDTVERVVLRDVNTGETRTMETAAVFIFIGQTPNNGLLEGMMDLDAGGHAIVDLEMRTSAPGLFVVGDLRTRSARQLISAAGDGATAAIAAEHYLGELPRRELEAAADEGRKDAREQKTQAVV
jgi:thioredoxin reductase (NADPH)